MIIYQQKQCISGFTKIMYIIINLIVGVIKGTSATIKPASEIVCIQTSINQANSDMKTTQSSESFSMY